MKILHIVKKYPNSLGGDAVVVYNLQKQQEAAGHAVVVVTSNCDEILNAKNIYKFGFKDITQNIDKITIKRVASLVILFFRIFAILGKERPNVIHTHSVDMAFFVALAAKLYRIPTVHTFHIVTFYDDTQSILRRKTELWLAKSAKLSSTTAPNEYDVKKLQESGLKQTVLLPNGVDLTQWETSNQQVSAKRTTFVAFGRLETQKGYEYLIKAVALLPGAENIHVIIAGEGSQKQVLQNLIRKLNVEKSITLVGRKTNEELRMLLAKSQAAVFPSLYETTPLTLLEAWASRTPVIATPIGILREVPDHFHAALVVPLKNEYALAEAMLQCIENPFLCKLTADAGYDEAKKFAWPHISKLAETIYLGIQ